MNRILLLALTTSLFLSWATGAPAKEPDRFDIYGQYERVTPPQATATGDKVEVLELFWYGCPHCAHFEPHLQAWLKTKPEGVTFRRLPAVFRSSWIPQARAYFTAELLGVLDQTHQALFDAIHRDKRPLNDREALAGFFVEHGVDRDKFMQTYDSFAVQSKVRRAQIMTQRYGIQGVPSVIVNGRYRTSGSLAGSYANMIKVMNILAAEEMGDGSAVAASDDRTSKP